MPGDARVREVARRLDVEHGPRVWRQHQPPIDELVATILSQHTSDQNTERAFQSLRERFPTWEEVVAAPTAAVAAAIRCGGLANQKAPRIQAVLRQLGARNGDADIEHLTTRPLSEARSWLEALPGVGPKTASCVLLFSLGMPAMPVDTHVHRVSRRLGLIGPTVGAEAAHPLLEAALGGNRDDVYAFHLNLIAHGRTVCTARRAFCERCPLVDCCDYAAQRVDAAN